MYVDKQTSLYTRVLYFDSVTGTEAHYICVDYTRINWMITEYAADIPVPSWIPKTLSNIARLFFVEVVLVFSNSNSLTASQLSDLETGVNSVLPKFVAARDLYQFDWTSC
jgi:hypothetical protein